jgi:Mg-chelatase subunit ChlD
MRAVPGIACLFVTLSCAADPETDRRDVAAEIDVALTPPGLGDAQPRDGIAAALLIDVSGSMDDEIRGEGRKIVLARRAALELVKQFDAYADAHPAEPVLIGVFEFSGPGESRAVVPLSAPDAVAAEAAMASLRAHGGTAIGEAMIEGKQALDRSGLSRRHLLVVTDGETPMAIRPAA